MQRSTFLISLLLLLITEAFGQDDDIIDKDTVDVTYHEFFNQKEDTLLLFIKLKSFSQSEKYHLYNGLIRLSIKNNAFQEKLIQRKDNIFSFIDKTYNLSFDHDKKVFRSLVDSVSKINDLDDKKTIYFGDSILLPTLPVKPALKSTNNYTQFFDYYSNTISLCKTRDIFSEKSAAQQLELDYTLGGAFASKLKENDIDIFLSELPFDMIRRKLGNEIFVLKKPRLIDVTFPDTIDVAYNSVSSQNIITSQVKQKIDSIDRKKFGQYVVLDSFYKDDCTHGQQVMQVIRTRLSEFGLSEIIDSIKIIPINYFQNEEFGIAFLKNYYQSREIEEREEGLKLVKTLEKLKKKKEKPSKGLPDFYLSALFSYWYNQRPDVISSSFYVTINDNKFSLIPRIANVNVSLITAALNEESNIEDKMFIGTRPTYFPVGAPEPLFSYFTTYSEAGAIITGCYLSPGKYSGMKSIDGTRISILGKGIGWGTSTTCLQPNVKGTSFATPDIGVSLFIAKAYWKTNNLNIDAKKARLRLLLSIDLDSSLIGKFAAAGTINMLKLLQYGKGYIEDISGEVVPSTLKKGFVVFTDSSRFNLGNGSNDVGGICILSNTTFCFMQSTLSWQKKEILSLEINLIKENEVTRDSITLLDFKTKYRQFVTF